MGNRAVITFAPYSDDSGGVYIHWNGGRASVEGFLGACRALGYRSPGYDPQYAMARLAQVITTFFEGGLSVAVGVCRSLDCNNGDNGTYIVGGDWEIVGRMFHDGPEEIDAQKTAEMAAFIVERIKASAAVNEVEK